LSLEYLFASTIDASVTTRGIEMPVCVVRFTLSGSRQRTASGISVAVVREMLRDKPLRRRPSAPPHALLQNAGNSYDTPS